MAQLRPLLASAIGAGLVFGVLGLWLRWPMFLAVTVAALLGVLFLMLAAALGEDPRTADEAWRKATADLFTAPADREAAGDGQPVAIEPSAVAVEPPVAIVEPSGVAVEPPAAVIPGPPSEHAASEAARIESDGQPDSDLPPESGDKQPDESQAPAGRPDGQPDSAPVFVSGVSSASPLVEPESEP